MALYPSSGSPAHSLFGNGDGLQSASPQLVAYLICRQARENVVRASGVADAEFGFLMPRIRYFTPLGAIRASGGRRLVS
jgi:hypothetical protein